MAEIRLFVEGLTGATEAITLEGEEAEHFRKSRRGREGDGLTLLNGRGLVAWGVVTSAKRQVEVRVEAVREIAQARPRVEVWAATPKGPRVDGMIDQLTQAGAAAWRPLVTKLGVVEPRRGKLGRMERIARESCKQCGRAWAMDIGDEARLEDAFDGRAEVIVADARGEWHAARGAPEIRLLIGPEGGWTEREIETARERGARVCRFGPHVMRIETAAPVACAMVMAAERAEGGGV